MLLSRDGDGGDDGSTLPHAPEAGRSPRRRARRRHGDRAATAGADHQTIPLILLAVAVIGSVLAIGAVHLPVLVIVAGVVFAAAAFALRGRAVSGDRILVPLPAAVCAALAAYTLLQAAPLPLSVLRAIAPANADVWERCLLPLGEAGPAWASISLDPGASAVEALKWAVYAAVLTTSATVAVKRGAESGVIVVFASACLAALTTLFHGLLGATTVYGLYEPATRRVAWHVGPLLNPNNLAGYLNLGAMAGLGLALSHRARLPRWAVVLGVALIVAIDVTSASRGGVLALPLGVVALALAQRARQEKQVEGPGASTWLIVFAVAGGAILAALGGTRETWVELYDKNVSKLEMVLWAKPMVLAHPWLGVGRGAFESTFPAYNVAPGFTVFTHAENFPAQWVTEWGLPVGLGALGAFAWAFAPGRLGVRGSAVVAGAWLGVLVVLVQNLVDLALEVPSVSIAIATVLGSLWGGARRHARRDASEDRAGEPPRWPLVPAIAIAVAGAALATLALAFGWRDVGSDRAAIRRALDETRLEAPAQRAALRSELRAAMLRHPAEPYFPLVGGVAAFRSRDQSPIPWIQRTLERAHVNGRAHLLLADVLAAQNARRQALLEARLAVQDDTTLITAAALAVLRVSRSFDELLTAAPEGPTGVKLLGRMAADLPGPADAELRGRLDREAITRDATFVEPRVREVTARIEAMTPGSTSILCADRERCRVEIEHHLEAILGAQPDSSLAAQLRARMLVADGEPERAVKLLEKTCDRVSDRLACLLARFSASISVKAPEPLNAAAKDLMGAGCITPASCADTATTIGDARAGRGEPGAALALFARAAREDPTEARWLKLANAAAQLGAHAQAAEALEKVARLRGGHDPELKRRIDELRGKAMGKILGQ